MAERGKVLGVTCATGAEAEEAYSSTKEIVDYKRFSDSDSVLLLTTTTTTTTTTRTTSS